MQIDGAELRHYPDTDTLEIDSRASAHSAPTPGDLASAIRALANGDGSEGAAVRLGPGGAREAARLQDVLEFRPERVPARLSLRRAGAPAPAGAVRQGGAELRADGMSTTTQGINVES